MKVYGISVDIKNKPPLDADFIPFGAFKMAFEKSAKDHGGEKFTIAIERNSGQISTYETVIHGKSEYFKADRLYIERLIKFLLWMKGGYSIHLYGNQDIGNYIKYEYSKAGRRKFDADFMCNVYENPFEVVVSGYESGLKTNETGISINRNLKGCRIGFDAGGSDRKVAAVIDGEVIFSEEVVWHPKLQSDPGYHYKGILSAFKAASAHMPRVDAIGVSSAGIYIDNRCMVASLFLKVPREKFENEVKDIYIRAAGEMGVDLATVCNDGDVAALAGAMELGENNVLGIAMGTSEAAGYVDKKGYITGWLNELAFAPVDIGQGGAIDEWSGDFGCGVQYFSQDAVIRLAPAAGITLEPVDSPAKKLSAVQELIKKDDERAKLIFETMGVYLGHTLVLYFDMYGMENVLILGRATSGKGGEIIKETALRVLKEEYFETNNKLKLHLPDEKSRRVGQAVAAAYLPEFC